MDLYSRLLPAAMARLRSPRAFLVAMPTTELSFEMTLLTLVGAVLPATLVLLYLLASTGLPQAAVRAIIPKHIRRWTEEFISVEDVVQMEEQEKEERKEEEMMGRAVSRGTEESTAEEHEQDAGVAADERTPLLLANSRDPKDPLLDVKPSAAITFGLIAVALFHLAGWSGSLAYQLVEYQGISELTTRELVVTHALIGSAWAYVLVRSLLRPQRTPPYDTLAILLVNAAGTLLRLHYIIVSATILRTSAMQLGIVLVSLLLIGYAISLIGSMPIRVYSKEADILNLSDPRITLTAPERSDVDASKLSSPEDTCRLIDWVTFRWVNSLLRATRKGKLDERDVWQLGKFLKARVVSKRFDEVPAKNLALRIFKANSKDLLLDVSLTFISAVLEYASPFFLKRILEAIQGERRQSGPLTARGAMLAFVYGGEHSTKETAYLFSFFAFVAVVIRSQADLYHLYYGRRAATRCRSELTSSIYAKGLRGKDVSGLVDARGKEGGVDRDEQDQKGQGVGRVVSLMAVDAVRVSNFLSMLYWLYGAPIELLIALVFLFNLLGWSAFAGLLGLVIATPLQSIMTQIGIRLSKRTGNIRDTRMTALSEFIGNLKIIKLVSWEKNFITRILDIRRKELDLLFKRQIVQSCMSFLWTIAPASVSVLAFASYTLIEKKELSVPVAFTALNLYQMLAGPLNVIPLIINEGITVYVCCDRIEKFLK